MSKKYFVKLTTGGGPPGRKRIVRAAKNKILISIIQLLCADLEHLLTFYFIFFNYFQVDPDQLAADDRKQKHVSFDSSTLMR